MRPLRSRCGRREVTGLFDPDVLGEPLAAELKVNGDPPVEEGSLGCGMRMRYHIENAKRSSVGTSQMQGHGGGK